VEKVKHPTGTNTGIPERCEVCNNIKDGELIDEIGYCNHCRRVMCNLCWSLKEHQDSYQKYYRNIKDETV